MATKRSLKDLGADEFVANTDQFKGPYVIVKVDGTDFELPSGLLCYHSKFFDRAFNGKFKEGVEKSMVLGECTVPPFELVVQWIYTGHINLPTSLFGDMSGSITLLIEFLSLADRLDLLGPFDSVVKNIEVILSRDFALLKAKHIRSAAILPKGHPLRHLLARACVQSYVYHTSPVGARPKNPRAVFKFQKELDDFESFSSDLLKAHGEFLRSGWTAPRDAHLIGSDPFTGQIFMYYPVA